MSLFTLAYERAKVNISRIRKGMCPKVLLGLWSGCPMCPRVQDTSVLMTVSLRGGMLESSRNVKGVMI